MFYRSQRGVLGGREGFKVKGGEDGDQAGGGMDLEPTSVVAGSDGVVDGAVGGV